MKKFKLTDRKESVGIVFVLPFIVGLILFFIPTVIMGLQFAFSDVTVAGGLSLKSIGFENFRYALRVDANFLKLAVEDIGSLLTTLPLVIVFSLFIAVLLNGKIWGKSMFRVLFFLPVIVGVGMLAANNSGVVMDAMNSGVSDNETQSVAAISDMTAMLQSLNFSPALVDTVSSAANNIVEIINRSGVQILIFLAGIQSISPSVYESAEVEGASGWEVFWKITLPMIMPMMLANVLFTFVDSITRDNTKLMTYVSSIAFTNGNYGASTAMSWLHYFMLLFTFAILALVALIVLKRVKATEGGNR